jgi:hypothetical protein
MSRPAGKGSKSNSLRPTRTLQQNKKKTMLQEARSTATKGIQPPRGLPACMSEKLTEAMRLSSSGEEIRCGSGSLPLSRAARSATMEQAAQRSAVTITSAPFRRARWHQEPDTPATLRLLTRQAGRHLARSFHACRSSWTRVVRVVPSTHAAAAESKRHC